MKKISLLITALFVVLMVHAQTGTKQSFIPAGWKLLEEASGDLNKDSVNDAAIIIELREENQDGLKPRSLLILLKEKKGELYTLSCKADHVILDGQSGGMLGDPFESMGIKKNVLIIKFFGGSGEKWSITHRYRLKDNLYFSVIGATYQLEDQGVTNTYDYNLLNGSMIITTKDAGNQANNKTVNKTQQLTPINLADFEPDALWAILMPKEYDPNIVELKLTDAGLGDCFHIFFDDMDFGNAELYLDEASRKLWLDLTASTADDQIVVNPKYKGKTFELTYIGKLGTKCEPEGATSYQLLIGFKLIN